MTFFRCARILGAVPVALLCACGTVPVRVPVMRPAEINMASYQSVAVADMHAGGDAAASARDRNQRTAGIW